MATKTAARKLFKEALNQVESKSIRQWATSDHNFPIWVEITRQIMDKSLPVEETRNRLMISILAEAIGL